MTENEAIKVFNEPSKHIRKFSVDGEETICYSTDLVKAFEIAIQALEEIQQYRAIGTPTQIYEKIGGLDVELGKYHEIGTIEEFKALKEKNTPKKVAYQGEHEKCPNCGSFHVFGKHCTECGQAVDYD